MQSTEDEVVHQISVLHEDAFVRTYTVSDAEFNMVGDCDPDSEPDPQRTQCFIDKEGEKLTRKHIDEVSRLFSSLPGCQHRDLKQHRECSTESLCLQRMKSRKYKGGCEAGQKMIAEKQELKDMTGTRIQYWDTTQADWYAGRIVGMWYDKPTTHFLCEFDDETEYAVDFQQDSWRLVCIFCP